MIEEGGGFSREGHQGAEFKTPTFVFSTRALKDRVSKFWDNIFTGFFVVVCLFFSFKKTVAKGGKKWRPPF